ncbi:MAG: 3'-5' exonuclease [Woeseiaceae bacterium]|nr:3'-5' exonuclease [Woeseiaceae bacterium]
MLLDYRVQHLLIDEMQDTATGQYRLVGQLTAGWEPGDGRTLFCVGDPMQSIYRFRDAEVGQFVAARHNGIGERTLEPLVLRQNFRSGERLVSWFNSTFSRILPAMDDVATGAISHAPSRPVAARAGTGRVAVHALVDASPEDEAGCSADAIEACLAEDESSRVAVLVRSRTQLPQLLAQLRRRGVSCQAIEIDRLTDLPEIIDLLTLTRALCHDGDRIAWLGLLRSPWTGMRWADVHALVRNDRASTVRELAADRERLGALGTDGRARLQRLFRVLDEAAPPHGSRTLRERVERAWMSLGGPGCMTDDGELDNAYRFLDVLERLEFAGTLPDVAQLEQQLDEERVSSPADERTRVQVMTMHKAKGLEFEHVVLHGLGRTTGSGSRDVLAWLTITGDDGSSSLIISPLGPRATLERDPLHRFIERSARESDRLELDRLLYVACTRAASSLHLVGSVASRRNGRELGRPPQTACWPGCGRSWKANSRKPLQVCGAQAMMTAATMPIPCRSTL